MHSYLIAADYNKQIQDVNLQQIINSTQSILESAQLAAEAEAKSYLRQKYDVSKELAATTPWNPLTTYYADNTVYLTALPYSTTATSYPLKSLVTQAGGVYICIVAIIAAEAFNPAKWTLLGTPNQIFYGKYPEQLFNCLDVYKKGDKVYWSGKTYTAVQESRVVTPQMEFAANTIIDTPVINVFPDDPVSGVSYWGNGVAHTIPAGTLPTDATKWVDGDNRDQQLVMYFVDITLYHVHSRIAPRNIPELRIGRYKAAIEWLLMCAQGAVTPELPLIQPKSGGRIRHGGNPKAQNSY